jgi:integrase
MKPRARGNSGGIVEACRDATGNAYYRCRVKLADGSWSHRIEIPPEKRTDLGKSQAFVAWAQEQERLTNRYLSAKVERAQAKGDGAAALVVATGETCDQWFKRYHDSARKRQSDADKKRTRWNKWVSPRIGKKRPEDVTADDVEDIRNDLDAAIAEWVKRAGKSGREMGRAVCGKTAMNVWTALTSSFKAMTSGKDRDLRVLKGKPNPCHGVEPPGDRSSRRSRRKTFVYPREAATLLSTPGVPIEWREIYAVAIYTYLRPGELRVLLWADVDLEAGLVSVTKAWDYADEKIKPPKSEAGVRDVPIDPNLKPLLRRMRKGREPGDLLVPALSTFGEDHLAEQWRRHLRLAKITRSALHASTMSHVQSNFRSCRDTGITWLAMNGLDMQKIKRRAGHEKIATTDGYVKVAEDLSGGDLGIPFGPLPASLTSPPRSTSRSTEAPIGAILGEFSAGGGSRIRSLPSPIVSNCVESGRAPLLWLPSWRQFETVRDTARELRRWRHRAARRRDRGRRRGGPMGPCRPA